MSNKKKQTSGKGIHDLHDIIWWTFIFFFVSVNLNDDVIEMEGNSSYATIGIWKEHHWMPWLQQIIM